MAALAPVGARKFQTPHISDSIRSGKGGKLTVTLSRTNELLLLEVTDDGAGGARPYLKPESGGESGRGMRVVDALALRWGYRPDGDRTTVWAEFPA